MMFSAYVAAPWPRCREALDAHNKLVAAGMRSTARWIFAAVDSGFVEPQSAESRLRGIAMNDADIKSSGALLVLSYPSEGGEMFAEVRYALTLGRPVVWVRGRQILSAYREGVTLVDSVDEGIVELKKLATWTGGGT